MRPSHILALGAGLLTAAPAFGAPVGGLMWISICTGHGPKQIPVPKRDGPIQAKACHACTLPRKNALKRP